MRLLLHACCGPCALVPLEEFAGLADEVAVVFSNSNIHPYEEHERRLETLRSHADGAGVTVYATDYRPDRWIRAVADVLDSKEDRCRACYALRLSETARLASAEGFDAIATTLTISPYQSAPAIEAAGIRAAEAAGVDYVGTDLRDRYPEAVRRSRALGMYRQNYCGCLLSDVEARRERAERRELRQSAATMGEA